MRDVGGRGFARSRVAVGLMVAIGLVAVGWLTLVGGRPSGMPAASTPASNGLIAYSFDGDIFVGDPVTGATTAIVTGPKSHKNPIFSPDGTRIAFVSGDPGAGASIVVAMADGSDERAVIPKGFSGLLGPFAWTPDGDSIVAEHDTSGRLSLFDAAGRSEPRLITPPLPTQHGAIYFNPSAQQAPMFRPPNGDQILSTDWDAIDVFGADLRTTTPLARERLAEYEPYFVRWPTWSPDGAMIAFGLDLYDSARNYLGSGGPELFVMNADGSHARKLGPGWFPLWSPDNRSIAYERWGPDLDQPSPEIKIRIIDVGSGSERVLDSTAAPVKFGADVRTITWNEGHTWYYEGWQWSPDGRSVLLLENHQTRPLLVDIATDRSTEMPWLADSNPSWQRITSA